MSARAGDYRIRITVEYHAGEDGFVPSDVSATVAGLDERDTKLLHAHLVTAGIVKRHELLRDRAILAADKLEAVPPDEPLASWIAKVDDVSTPHELEVMEAELSLAEFPSVGARAAIARARDRVARFVEGEAMLADGIEEIRDRAGRPDPDLAYHGEHE